MKRRDLIRAAALLPLLLATACGDGDGPAAPVDAPPGPVANFAAVPGTEEIALTWTNPGDADFDRVEIRRGVDTTPQMPADGEAVYDGAAQTHTDTGLAAGPTYHYTIFAFDAAGQSSAGVSLQAQALAPATVTFPDPALEAVVRAALGQPTGPITAAACGTVTAIEGDGAGIADLTGLEAFSSLASLRLPGNALHDAGIAPLRDLTTLVDLRLTGGDIRALNDLARLVNLETLDLADNAVVDIEKLEPLTALTTLNLNGNFASDLESLALLTGLTELRLAENGIHDLRPLAGLAALRILELRGNSIGDIKPLTDNPGLDDGDWLDLSDNRLSTESLTVYIPELEARGVTVLH